MSSSSLKNDKEAITGLSLSELASLPTWVESHLKAFWPGKQLDLLPLLVVSQRWRKQLESDLALRFLAIWARKHFQRDHHTDDIVRAEGMPGLGSRGFQFRRMWKMPHYIGESEVRLFMQQAWQRQTHCRGVAILKECMTLPAEQRMHAYLRDRLQIAEAERFFMDRLVCEYLLTIPSHPDCMNWAKSLNTAPYIGSVAVPTEIDLEIEVAKLFGAGEVDWQSSESLGGHFVHDFERKIPRLALWFGDDECSGYHSFYVPIPLTRGLFRMIFTYRTAGRFGSLIGVTRPSAGEPMLAFDIGGCEDVCAKPAFSARAQLCDIGVPDWEQPDRTPKGWLHADCNPTLTPCRMTLEVNVARSSLALFEGYGRDGNNRGRCIASMRDVRYTWGTTGRKVASEVGLAGCVVFFAFSPDEHGYNADWLQGSFVGVEAIDII